MALQTDRLVMAALSVLGDVPPNTIQPPLVDGIHLRWSCQSDLGFPWYGFFLFRRAHRPSRPICFGQILPKIPPGPWPSAVLNTPFGQVSSDRPLVFTDDFPAGGVAEFDLRARTYVRFSLDPAQSAYRAEARIGFRKRQGERTCLDFRPRAGFVGPNPLIEADTTFEVRGHDGTPAAQTRVSHMGTLTGLNVGHRLQISLPCKASAVELTLAHFSSPGRVHALDSAGAVVATASLPSQQGVPQVLHLSGQDIARVVVDAPQNETLLLEVCFSCGTGSSGVEAVTVKALQGGLVILEATAQGAPGQVVTVELDAEAITLRSRSVAARRR
jgi:hypothetical protein